VCNKESELIRLVQNFVGVTDRKTIGCRTNIFFVRVRFVAEKKETLDLFSERGTRFIWIHGMQELSCSFWVMFSVDLRHFRLHSQAYSAYLDPWRTGACSAAFRVICVVRLHVAVQRFVCQ